MTTGMFPQQVVIAMVTRSQVDKLRLMSKNVKSYSVSACTEDKPIEFKQVLSATISGKAGRMQSEIQVLDCPPCNFLKITIHSGYENFVAIHKIVAEGSAA